MEVKLTYYNYKIIKAHSIVAVSTFYIAHFFKQFVAVKKKL